MRKEYINFTDIAMEDKSINKFFEELAKYYSHENDLSNITVALCNSNLFFKEKFLHFFFPNLPLGEIKNISREVFDAKGMGSRVDIHIPMTTGDIYIIEVKINDRNHHFGQYEVAYEINKSHFGYITNYYCPEGKELGYDIKKWEDFYKYLNKSLYDEKEEVLTTSYLKYLKKVCNIKTYHNLMNFKSLETIPQFFHLFDRIINEESYSLNIYPLTNRGNAETYSYKEFSIKNKTNTAELTKGYVMLYYAAENTISIGIANSGHLNLQEIEINAKGMHYQYSKEPRIESEWWNYLWYTLSAKELEEIDRASLIEKQENIIREYLKEVIASVRLYEKDQF